MDFLVCIQTNHHSDYQSLHYDMKSRKQYFFADELVRQLARPLTTSYDGKFYESIPFVDFS